MDGPFKDEFFGLEYSAILKYSTNSLSERLSSSKKDVVRPVFVGIPRGEKVMTIADTELRPFYYFPDFRYIVYLGKDR